MFQSQKIKVSNFKYIFLLFHNKSLSGFPSYIDNSFKTRVLAGLQGSRYNVSKTLVLLLVPDSNNYYNETSCEFVLMNFSPYIFIL